MARPTLLTLPFNMIRATLKLVKISIKLTVFAIWLSLAIWHVQTLVGVGAAPHVYASLAIHLLVVGPAARMVANMWRRPPIDITQTWAGLIDPAHGQADIVGPVKPR
jgi:hypothetical protein